ncbi:hypothetical protein HMPREF9151_00256 [Hoylesella saccharolytica F0055]|uniref:Uncharacterized protein n=1 Tax=Hoylesella saccharolytica F0055 TaxID=1127699 RepID=L1NJA8_9BACT|nr:hypothetical protein HMPREF9151_00256 [Hoylesella saccharolytica F0055]
MHPTEAGSDFYNRCNFIPIALDKISFTHPSCCWLSLLQAIDVFAESSERSVCCWKTIAL